MHRDGAWGKTGRARHKRDRTEGLGNLGPAEVRRRAGRFGSTSMVARIHLSDASPMPLPGMVVGGAALPKSEFQEQVGTHLGYWQQATGRTENVLFIP